MRSGCRKTPFMLVFTLVLGLFLSNAPVLSAQSNKAAPAKAKIIVKKEYLGRGKVPCIVAYPSGSKKAPVIFVCHGLTGNKESMKSNGVDLAARGFFTVMPDALWHGERAKDGVDVHWLMYDIIINSVKEVSNILDTLKDDPRADCRQAGIAGYSMGGMTAFLAPLQDKRFAAASPWCGNADWVGLARQYGVYDDPFINKYSPLEHPDKYYPCAILAQHGGIDYGMSVGTSEALFAKIKPQYRKDPGRLKTIEYPGVGHVVTDPMVKATGDWFEKYLK